MPRSDRQAGITRRRLLQSAAASALLIGSGEAARTTAMALPPPAGEKMNGYWETTVTGHPAEKVLRHLFPEGKGMVKVTPTGRTRADYLPVIAGIVDFFKTYQDTTGAIIDPFEKKERQYSTPAFALGAAILAAEAKRADLWGPAAHGFDFALAALANHTTADNHADFYIPLLMHTHRLLLAHGPAAEVTAERKTKWVADFRSLIPEKTYRDVTGSGNWNIVNLAGEFLRRKDGLVAPDQREAQADYLERCLDRQHRVMTPYGMYLDANAPLAYDAFPRLWLEDALADGAYDGPRRAALDTWLAKGSLSTLLLLSPIGEWANGGRSALHQWNEAEIAVICEASAVRWHRNGRPDIAGACKRAAHLALGSLQRWRRPSGELWIVKNRAEPSVRHGYEGYSFHSQYNLLAGAMLAIAYLRADESIPEQPTPAERGGYVFDLRETFHKVCAAAGGAYLLLDTSADPHYNASGLLRLQRTGVTAPLLSDNAAADRSYGPSTATDKAALTTGLTWETADGKPQGVADARGAAVLNVSEEKGDRVKFSVSYTIGDIAADSPESVQETYTLESEGVTVQTRVPTAANGRPVHLTLPALVSDGATDTRVSIEKDSAKVATDGAELVLEVRSPKPTAAIQLAGPRLVTHNGYVRAATVELPAGTREITYRLRLHPVPKA